MCRLYAMRANEPTRVECSLVRAQNALMAQSRSDLEGVMHGHGWGVADYSDGVPLIEKQTWAAFHGEHFQKTAARVYGHTVIAHVRRATVGPPSIANTHPFSHGSWIFAHNGTVPNFDQIRDRLIEKLDDIHRNSIHGETDSEHVFHYLLSLWSKHPEYGLAQIVRQGVRNIVSWCQAIELSKPIGLNIVLTDGQHMAGARLNRSLWFLERDHTFNCPICKSSHVHHRLGVSYRAVEVASEPLTQEEEWKGVPNETVFSVDQDFGLRIEPLAQ